MPPILPVTSVLLELMRHGERGAVNSLPFYPPDELTSGGVDGLMRVEQLTLCARETLCVFCLFVSCLPKPLSSPGCSGSLKQPTTGPPQVAHLETAMISYKNQEGPLL